MSPLAGGAGSGSIHPKAKFRKGLLVREIGLSEATL